MKVIGFRKSSLKGNDGTEVSGVNLYLTDKCEKGEGLSCDRIYVMDKILASCGYTPKLNEEVSSSITAGASAPASVWPSSKTLFLSSTHRYLGKSVR